MNSDTEIAIIQINCQCKSCDTHLNGLLIGIKPIEYHNELIELINQEIQQKHANCEELNGFKVFKSDKPIKRIQNVIYIHYTCDSCKESVIHIFVNENNNECIDFIYDNIRKIKCRKCNKDNVFFKAIIEHKKSRKCHIL